MLLYIIIFFSFRFVLRFKNFILNVLKEMFGIKKIYGGKEYLINVSKDL